MTDSDWTQGWLVGARGLHHSHNGTDWTLAGGRGYPVHDLIRVPGSLYCATMWGVWHVEAALPWRQLHDETLTEVLGIALNDCDPQVEENGLAAVSPYGLAFSEPGEHGATRWHSQEHGLSLNERFSSALLADADAPGQWIVGTEAGVLIWDSASGQWLRTNLTGLPCRALLRARGSLWAGTDGGGVWRSIDGVTWQRAGTGLDNDSVFSLAAAGERILVGTLRGICVGDGDTTWQRSGPSLLISAVAAHPTQGGLWLAGAFPGGLWRSDDSGCGWRQVGDFDSVHRIMAPA